LKSKTLRNQRLHTVRLIQRYIFKTKYFGWPGQPSSDLDDTNCDKNPAILLNGKYCKKKKKKKKQTNKQRNKQSNKQTQ